MYLKLQWFITTKARAREKKVVTLFTSRLIRIGITVSVNKAGLGSCLEIEMIEAICRVTNYFKDA